MQATKKRKALWSAFALLAAFQLVIGCAATRGRHFSEPKKSGFLGDYSQLKDNPEFPLALVHIKPGVPWANFNSVQLESAGLWLNEQTKDISPEDQQHLTDILYGKIFEELGKVFTVTNQPGPNTLRLRVALTQAQGAKVAVRVVTTVVPQLRTATGLLGMASDTAATVGSATVEMEALDPVTNEQLAAVMSQRAGTKVIFAKRTYETWGDVEAACDRWASRTAWQLARLGVQRKPGVGMPEEPSESRSL